MIAASCTNEAFKMVTNSASLLNNYMLFSGDAGIYTHSFELEKNPDCLVCGSSSLEITISSTATLQELIDLLLEMPKLQLKRPSLRTASVSLYMQAPKQLEVLTRPNLAKCVKEMVGDTEIALTDANIPISIRLFIKYD